MILATRFSAVFGSVRSPNFTSAAVVAAYIYSARKTYPITSTLISYAREFHNCALRGQMSSPIKENKRASRSNKRKDLPIGYYDYTSGESADWRPWGLYDHKHIPPPDEQAFFKALDQLKIETAKQRATLLEHLGDLAVLYWRTRRSLERPPLKWYRKNIQPIRTAARNFLDWLEAENRREISGLDHLTQIVMNRPLVKNNAWSEPNESIEQLLRQFINVCDRSLRPKAHAGAPKDEHVVAAARRAVKHWEEATGKRMGLSPDTITDEQWKFGPSKQVFTYPGPLFVLTILQGIDSNLDVATIRTALRNALSKANKQKLETD